MKDRIVNGEIEVVYCPTDEMIGDFFTKPLQWKKFEQFRSFIMGLHLQSPQERVVEMGETVQVEKDLEFWILPNLRIMEILSTNRVIRFTGEW